MIQTFHQPNAKITQFVLLSHLFPVAAFIGTPCSLVRPSADPTASLNGFSYGKGRAWRPPPCFTFLKIYPPNSTPPLFPLPHPTRISFTIRILLVKTMNGTWAQAALNISTVCHLQCENFAFYLFFETTQIMHVCMPTHIRDTVIYLFIFLSVYRRRLCVWVCVIQLVWERVFWAHWRLNNEVHGKRWRSYWDPCPHSSELAHHDRKPLQKH